jgi:hypothetical protein
MSFYLLKSKLFGDVLIDANRVENVVLGFKRKGKYKGFIIVFTLFSSDTLRSIFDTIEEAKKVIKDVLGDRIDDESLDKMEALDIEKKNKDEDENDLTILKKQGEDLIEKLGILREMTATSNRDYEEKKH